jgi:hypothetical protein
MHQKTAKVPKQQTQVTAPKPLAKNAITLAKKSPFAKDSHDHALFTLLQKQGVSTKEEAMQAMHPFLTKLGVKKNELDKWAKTMYAHFKKEGAL